MKSRPGTLADYKQTAQAMGTVMLSGPETFMVGNGVITHFLGDHRIYRNDGGRFTALNGPVGGSGQTGLPFDKAALITRIGILRSNAEAFRFECDALIAMLKA